MELYNKLTKTELNVEAQKLSKEHEKLKEIMASQIEEIRKYDNVVKSFNENLKKLNEIEENYVKIIELLYG